MTGILIYVIMAFGVAYVLGHAMITRATREWAHDFGMIWRLVELPAGEIVKPGSTQWQPRVRPLRWLVDLLECPACCGFHTGFWLGIFFAPIFVPPTFWIAMLTALGIGFFTAGSNYLLGRLTGLVPPKEN